MAYVNIPESTRKIFYRFNLQKDMIVLEISRKSAHMNEINDMDMPDLEMVINKHAPKKENWMHMHLHG